MVYTAFPDIYVECAFDSNLSEALYAQTGWTDITEWVRALNGATLRGRSYELDTIQTGSVAVTLDNADGRFTPDHVPSPYYPNVTAGRRMRVRGKNMQSPNVARSGAQDHSAIDFFLNPNNDVRYSSLDDTVIVEGETYEASSGGTVIAATRDPQGGGTEVTYVKATSWLSYIVDLEDRVAASVSARVASQDGCTIQIRTGSPTGTVIGSAPVAAKHNWTSYATVDIDISGANLTGSQTLYVTFTSLGGTYALNLNWLEFKTSGQHISQPVAVQHDPAQIGLSGALAADTEGWHIEATIDTLQPEGDARVISWFTPIELGVRLTHSAYIWLVAGTEPVDTWVALKITYYDANRNVLREDTDGWQGTPGTPTRHSVSSLPPATAKYAIGSVAISTDNPYTTALTYAVCGIQTELPANLAPNISGQGTLTGWTTDGGEFVQVGVAEQGTGFIAGLPDNFELSNWTTGGSPTSTTTTLTLPNGPAGVYNSVLSQARAGTGSGFSVAVSAANTMQDGAEFYATLWASDDNLASFIVSGASWVCRVRQAGVNTDYTVTTTHPSLPARVCVYESNGKIYWLVRDTEADDWTVLHSADHAIDFSVAGVQLQSGSWQATTANPITVTELNTDFPEPGVQLTWAAGGTAAWIDVHRLMPGTDYSVIVEVTVSSGPAINVTIDGGLNTISVPADGTPYDVSFNFTADTITQPLRFEVDGGVATAGETVTIRGINIVVGDDIPELGDPGDTQATEWEHPCAIFDGWVEEWPVTMTAGTTEWVEVTVDDRLSKLANTTLDNVLIEEMRADGAALILPLTDAPNDAGMIAMSGTWADASGQSAFALTQTRGSLGSSSYELGVPGPIGDNATALKLTAATPTTGFVILPPWSPDYQATAAQPPSTNPPGTLPDSGLVVSKFYSTWHANYNEDNSYFSSVRAWQGDWGNFRGDMKALWGFNSAAIMAALAGAEIVSVTFTVENYNWKGSSGTMKLATHNYSSRPTTWSSSHVVERRYTVPNWAEDAYRTVRLLPNTVGVEFQNGTTKGIGIGPAGSSDKVYAGEFATSESGAHPVLIFTYRPPTGG